MLGSIKMPSMPGIEMKIPEIPKLLGKKVKVIPPHFKLKLTVHRCKGLAKADLFGKSDPVVVVKYKGKEVSRSPVVSKNLNPEWGKTTDRGVVGGHKFEPDVMINCKEDGKLADGEKEAKVGVEVYDSDLMMLGDFLGQVTFTSGRILGMKGSSDVQFQLQQLEGCKKKSKLVKGTIYLSIDNEFDKGGAVEEETAAQAILDKGLDLLGKK